MQINCPENKNNENLSLKFAPYKQVRKVPKLVNDRKTYSFRGY